MPRDKFGKSVTISGNLALIGSPRDDDQGLNSGSAYLFNWITGEQIHKLTPAIAEPQDYFGSSVSMANGLAFVGAPTIDKTGYAVLFNLATGAERIRFDPSDNPQWAWFGQSVAIGGELHLSGAVRPTCRIRYWIGLRLRRGDRQAVDEACSL